MGSTDDAPKPFPTFHVQGPEPVVCPNCAVLEARIEEKQRFIEALLVQGHTRTVPNLLDSMGRSPSVPDPDFEGNTALDELATTVEAKELNEEERKVLTGAMHGFNLIHGGGVYDECRVINEPDETEEKAESSAA